MLMFIFDLCIGFYKDPEREQSELVHAFFCGLRKTVRKNAKPKVFLEKLKKQVQHENFFALCPRCGTFLISAFS